MIGAVAGDIIGSVHEFFQEKVYDFPLFTPGSRFTDDTVLSIAVAECLLDGTAYVDAFHDYANSWPDRGFGGTFTRWFMEKSREPYGSWGNGSAMRVGPVGFAFPTLEQVLEEARRSAVVTHDHPEGVKGAQAVAAAVFLARQGETKERIRGYLEETFGYDLHRTVEQIRPEYTFDVSCQGSVPEAIIAFLDSADFEDAVRLAVSLGGDADTQACMAGVIAEAYYGGVPAEIATEALARLDERLRDMLVRFCTAHGINVP